tara:strand:- start:3121 stop:3990 length:870 start_codon:yes stop_codon:yes gene_type:complete
MDTKGIILAGGRGTRLYPITNGISKQLIPIYNKPMIYYPLTTLMLAGIKEIMIITNPKDQILFEKLLGDGSQWGIDLKYTIQKNPNGIAEAFIICENFIDKSSVCLILGDNLFYGDSLTKKLQKNKSIKKGGTIFCYPVSDPERYGIVDFNSKMEAIKIQEKPKFPKTNYAVTGLYFYDNSVIEKSKRIKVSERGELEITDLNNIYLKEGTLKVELMNRGMAWLDTGTFDSLNEASSFIRTLEKRQGLHIGCPEEISLKMNLITVEQFKQNIKKFSKSQYGEYLRELIK